MECTYKSNYGEVSVKNVVAEFGELNFTDGIEIKSEENKFDTFQVEGFRSICNMKIVELESLIEDNQ